MSSLRQYTATQTLKFLAVGMLATAGAHAGATTLQITPSQSQVTYTPGTGFPICSFDGSGNISCPVAPAPETANLSGQIDLNVVHEHWEIRGNVVDRDLIYLTTRNFSAGTLSPVFPLAGAVGLLTGNTFQVRDDPCFYRLIRSAVGPATPMEAGALTVPGTEKAWSGPGGPPNVSATVWPIQSMHRHCRLPHRYPNRPRRYSSVWAC